MANILTEVLRKLGKKYEELRPAGKATFDRWEKVLSSGPIDIPKLKEFLEGEKEAIERDLASYQYELNSKEDMFLKAELHLCMTILTLFESPEKAAKMLETYLKRLHKIK